MIEKKQQELKKELKRGDFSEDKTKVWNGERWLKKGVYEAGEDMVQAMREIKPTQEMY